MRTKIQNELINHVYNIIEGEERLNALTKEDILELYTEIDYVYDLLESLDIVNVYSGFDLLQDFEVDQDTRGYTFIYNGDGYSKQVNIDTIINELYHMFIRT